MLLLWLWAVWHFLILRICKLYEQHKVTYDSRRELCSARSDFCVQSWHVLPVSHGQAIVIMCFWIAWCVWVFEPCDELASFPLWSVFSGTGSRLQAPCHLDLHKWLELFCICLHHLGGQRIEQYFIFSLFRLKPWQLYWSYTLQF